MKTNSNTPATKPQPVVLYGAVIAALVFIDGGLLTILKDNPTAVLWLGIGNVVLGGASVFKDQIVKGMTVPAADTVAYVNEDRQVVTGPAMPGPDGELVHDVLLDDGQVYHDGKEVVGPDEGGLHPAVAEEDPNELGRGIAGF